MVWGSAHTPTRFPECHTLPLPGQCLHLALGPRGGSGHSNGSSSGSAGCGGGDARRAARPAAGVGGGLGQGFLCGPPPQKAIPKLLGRVEDAEGHGLAAVSLWGGAVKLGTPLLPSQANLLSCPLSSPRLTCVPTAGAAFFWASVVLCLRPSCRSRSRGVMGRGKQLVGFLDYGEETHEADHGKRPSYPQTRVSELSGS